MSVPDKLHELVDRFQYHIADYKSGKYNETQVRRDFIDPLFGLLGWDIDNKEGNAEAYRDVIHEDSIKIGGATKAPDYCFRVGGTRKFFLEAKKPSIHIKEDVAASFQLRRYGWSARLSISILTDFEEFAVYDTRIKPAKSAWFMTHRIREAMADPVFKKQLGGSGKVVEADETFWGTKFKKHPQARGYEHKEKIFSLVERGGNVRSFHIEHVSGATLKPIIRKQVASDTHLMTDDFGGYKDLGMEFEKHSVIRHTRGEYVRGPISTNTIEGYFSILKRGLGGIYQHVKAKHLKRYIGEFDFRYNNRKISDVQRTDVALLGIGGKRLMYKA